VTQPALGWANLANHHRYPRFEGPDHLVDELPRNGAGRGVAGDDDGRLPALNGGVSLDQV
jgi:hypothetical protein